ncbi:MAG: hypothetical protein B6I24_11805 [Bacteroidetes bacterium 4572_128]|nr:MAG: hypothetical protein B6I24_11805 [Bacteroidetes bacterium 4572_128]
MKKTIIVALLILFIISSFFLTSCKRGEDDPFFSLYSRKMRVTGDWKLIDFERNTDITNLTDYETVTNFKIEGEKGLVTITTNIPNLDSTRIEQGTLNSDFTEIIFEKDGSYRNVLKYTIETNFTSEYDDSIVHVNTKRVVRVDKEGIWDFLDGVGEDYRDKERIVIDERQREIFILIITVTTVTDELDLNIHDPIKTDKQYNYYEMPHTEIWTLSRLANDEMVGNRSLNAEYDIFPREDGTYTLFHDISINGYGDESNGLTVEVKGTEKFIYKQ